MDTQKQAQNISVRSFITAIIIIFLLMVAAYVLTIIVPGGIYARVVNSDGNSVIDTAAGFTYTEGGIPFVKWLMSPILVLAAAVMAL